MTVTEWYGAGARTPVALPSGTWNVFTRLEGRTAAPWCTLFHGFPTSSWDWHAVWPTLTARRRTLAFDFLGHRGRLR